MPPETSAPASAGAADQKIIGIEDLAGVSARVHQAGERLVQCHGVFDLLHPGHITHLQSAKSLGDRLVVSVTADRHVDRGPGRPVFPQDLRMAALAALESVDYVVLSDAPTALEVIEALQPDIYCKGGYHADPAGDAHQMLEREIAAVESYGGEVRFLEGALYSSTRLLNQHFNVLPEGVREFAEEFSARHGKDKVSRVLDQLAQLKVLVVGDVIIDEYVRCQILGVTGKDNVPSVRHHGMERHWGGAFAIARHLASCVRAVTLATIAGEDERLYEGASAPAAEAPIAQVLTRDPHARTVVKRRYVIENRLRAELDKVFSVNYLTEPRLVEPVKRKRFRESLADAMRDHDLIVIADYGHGVLDSEAIELLQDQAPYLALNCQTNSANHGYNPITKYRRADTFCLDEGELTLAFRDRETEHSVLLARLREHLHSTVGWLTLGASGAMSIDSSGATELAPALTLHVRDTIGAGDAFFALASLCACIGEPPDVGAFLGNIAGAYAVNVTGNAKPVEKIELLQFASTILNV